MKKKGLILAAVMALSISAAACSMGNGNGYPVTVANYTFESKPMSVVCLSDSAADIMIACGYGDLISARTDECDQQELAGVPSVGSKNSPDVKKIEAMSPDVVLADASVLQKSVDQLKTDEVKVLNLIKAKNADQLITVYQSVGRVVEGEVSGKENGEKKASALLNTIDKLNALVPEGEAVNTACYLYDVNGTAADSSSFSGKLLDYAKLSNVCLSAALPEQQVENICISNPKYIFCDVGVKDKLMTDERYAKVSAVKSGMVFEIDADVFERQGDSMTQVLSYLIETVHPELAGDQKTEQPQTSQPQTSQPEASLPQTSVPENPGTESSVPQTSAEESSKPEESKVKVEADPSFTVVDGMTLRKEESGVSVAQLQQRLQYLGYFPKDEDTTDYFGEMTEAALKRFEKVNGRPEDGVADSDDLKLMFSAQAKPAA